MTEKFKAGDSVYAKENETLKLIVRRYVDGIYYCRIPDLEDQKEKVYFERELIGQSEVK